MEELTPAQSAELRQLIEQQCDELERLLAGTVESSKPVQLDQPIGRLSRMDALQQQQMAKASRDAQQQRLQLLRNALLAIANGTYGACRICEEPIGYQRLKVRPETPFCLGCQSRREGGA